MTAAGGSQGAAPPLTFTYDWSVREHARARNVIMLTRLQREALLVLLGVAVVVMLLADAGAVYKASVGENQYVRPAIIVTALVFLGLWFLLHGAGWASALHQRRTDSTIRHPIHHIFGEHGLRVRGKSAEVSLRWRGMRRVIETGDFILFYYTPGRAYYLPKRVASPESLAQLRALVRAHAGNIADLRA